MSVLRFKKFPVSWSFPYGSHSFPRKKSTLKTILRVENKKTGDFEDKIFYEGRKRVNNKGWYGVKEEGMRMMLACEDLRHNDWKVMVALSIQCQWQNVVQIKRKDLCSLAGTTRQSALESIKRLEANAFLVRDPGDPDKFYLDPYCCYKGEMASWAIAKDLYWQRVRVAQAPLPGVARR